VAIITAPPTGQPGRARALARAARDGFAAAGSTWDARRAQADALLARLGR